MAVDGGEFGRGQCLMYPKAMLIFMPHDTVSVSSAADLVSATEQDPVIPVVRKHKFYPLPMFDTGNIRKCFSIVPMLIHKQTKCLRL